MLERIPEELTAVRQWHCWKVVKNEKGDDVKVPIQVNGATAKSNDPKTWTDFEKASDAAQFHSGLAFEITEPWTGIDLDDCLDDDGLKPWAIEILFRFDGIGFAEVSPSGTGIKILTRGRKPAGSRCTHKFDDGQIEVYDNRRFWTITGDLYNGQDEIGDGQEAVNWICEKFLSDRKKSTEQPSKTTEPESTEQQEPEPKKQEQKTAIAPVIYQPLNSLHRRASAYVATIPPESQGGRNNAAFRLAGHLHSIVDENSQRLTDSEVLDLLREWNARNADPLPESELQTVVWSSRKNGTPREDKRSQRIDERQYPEVNLSKILGEERGDDFDDEEFCERSVPELGLIRQVYDYYCLTSHRKSHVMGLAVAVCLCETIFGRRIASHTDLRTNDYNVVIAPTTSGKEACETAITKILAAADISRMPMIPPDVQSGNGLMKAVSEIPCCVWVCDEFGKVLESILDRKSNNGHAKQIGTHLLKLYGKAAGMYGGAAHADGLRNQIVQPHLCLLGLTTGQMFETIDSRQIQDGLFGRLAFWPVQNRPKRKTARAVDVPDHLGHGVRQWLHWEPTGLNPEYPRPEILEMTDEALSRWEHHADAIDAKMEHESESRAAIWGRVAARAMKLAMVHRAARLTDDPSVTDWLFVRIERADIDWGIQLANWLGRVACGLIRENVVDRQAARAIDVLQRVVCKLGEIDRRSLLREYRSISCSEFTAAAEYLVEMGCLEIVEEKRLKGKPKVVYKNRVQGGE
jgi:hypothetical protein